MLYGFLFPPPATVVPVAVPYPFPGVYLGGFKSNGVDDNGTVAIGQNWFWGSARSSKGNDLVDVQGDAAWVPIWYGFSNDADVFDSPQYNFGRFY